MLKLRLTSLVVAASLFAAASAAHAQVKHVVQISVDGLSAKLLQQYIQKEPANYPTFKRMVDEGATTFNARTDFTHTVTLPNHTSMLTGRPVMPPLGMSAAVAHNYTLNADPPEGMTLHTCNPEVKYMSSTLEVAHDGGVVTAFYASKSKFSLYTSSFDDKHGKAVEGKPDSRNKIDHLYIAESPGLPQTPKILTSAQMHERVLKELVAYHPGYTFIHYRDCDSAGHAMKWDSPEYRLAVHNVDTRLGQLLKLLETDPQFKGNTTVVLTADHGGIPLTNNHAINTSPHDYTIPFFVWGSTVSHGDLYKINNKTRKDPGADRPDYTERVQPIRNGDAGNLALKLLGLPPIPGSIINAAQDLAVN
jgi:hypothetical protein